IAHEAETAQQVGGVHGMSYEEGTWTPSIAGDIVAGSNGYSLRSGTYIKINNEVSIICLVRLSSVDANMDGKIIINGLPFPATVLGTTYTIGRMDLFTYPSGALSIGAINEG